MTTPPDSPASAAAPAPPLWHTLPHAPAEGTLLGTVDELADGQALLRSVFSGQDVAQQHPFRVLLLRSGDTVRAYVNRCAHFGVPLAARQEHLHFVAHTSVTCNVHYARYRWSDGLCDRGECVGESLPTLPLAIDAQGCIRIAASAGI